MSTDSVLLMRGNERNLSHSYLFPGSVRLQIHKIKSRCILSAQAPCGSWRFVKDDYTGPSSLPLQRCFRIIFEQSAPTRNRKASYSPLSSISHICRAARPIFPLAKVCCKSRVCSSQFRASPSLQRSTPTSYRTFPRTMWQTQPAPLSLSSAFLPSLPLRAFPSSKPPSCLHSSPLKPRYPTLSLQTPNPPTLPSLKPLTPLPKPPTPAQSKRPSAPPQLTATGDSLESTPFQRFLVGFFAATSTLFLLKLVTSCHTSLEYFSTLSPLLFSYLFTDFAVGVYHHSVDNYGSADTPIFGYQINAFQGHHHFPWTITNRDVANNLYRLTIPTLPQLLLLLAVAPSNGFTAFYGSFLIFIVVSQEAHRQAHMTRSARWVKQLQDWGLIVGQGMHARHHRGAHQGNYCILSGVCNGWLDCTRAFRRWEAVVWRMTGVEPLCWGADPQLRTEALAFLPSWWKRRVDGITNRSIEQ